MDKKQDYNDIRERYKQAIQAVKDGASSPVEAAKDYDVDPCILSHGIIVLIALGHKL